jgi:MFS family permease
MPAAPPALRHPDFRRLWTSVLCSGVALQMAQVAIGWQVYSIRHNAFDLGLIGLAEFAPVPLLALPAGQLADRLPRVGVVMITSLGDAAVAGLLLVVTLGGAHELWQFVALAALTGTISALGSPAQRSLTPSSSPRSCSPVRSRCARSPARRRRSAGLRSAGSCSRYGRRLSTAPPPRSSSRRRSCSCR